ncbi:ATP-binding cassette transporter abc1 [Schizosaccharomyces japonicus yFS275]|uniref:ATP-binding cassette transporter abc1 n=1 Tax=Schizosaccharomyces japonicus (strain yFS275 / FY16936) TaxID=402676 RepID=B6K519_SCHJY|nr:ATP-binding cassette transporter abc1 [Schizosaccharomyces japonicus yFS275]EEB08623.1 ATP-binding cassette transporter abc1 [Schizosaccharomyces japonicus yFS275]
MVLQSFSDIYALFHLSLKLEWQNVLLLAVLLLVNVYLLASFFNKAFTLDSGNYEHFSPSGDRKLNAFLLYIVSLCTCLFLTSFTQPFAWTRLLVFAQYEILIVYSLRLLSSKLNWQLFYSGVFLSWAVAIPVVYEYAKSSSFVGVSLTTALTKIRLLQCLYIMSTIAQCFIPLSFPRSHRSSLKESFKHSINPEETCSYLSKYCTYSWLDGIIWKSFLSILHFRDIPPLSLSNTTKLWRDKFAAVSSNNILTRILFTLRKTIIEMLFLAVLVSLSLFITPYGMKQLLQYFQSGRVDKGTSPLFWTFVLLFGPCIASACKEYYVHVSRRYMLRIKAVLSQEIYEKVLTRKLPQTDHVEQKRNPDSVYNLLSVDVDHVANSREFIGLSVRAPLDITLSLVFLYNLLGWSTFAGASLAFLSAFLPLVIAGKISNLTSTLGQASDERVQCAAELLKTYRISKYFAWENAAVAKLDSKRNAELKHLRRLSVFDIMFSCLMKIFPLLSMYVTFFVFTKIQRRTLTPAIAFTSISLFSVLRNQSISVAAALRQSIQFSVSLRRISAFLDEPTQIRDEMVSSGDSVFELRNASVSWLANPKEDDFQLSNLSFTIPPKSTCLVVGNSGAGKTTLLLSFLGETFITSGIFKTPNPNVQIAYVPQIPWLLNDTIRNNVLFGNSFNKERYDMVLQSCALLPDLQSMPYQDMTSVGENGCNLSGGQRHRLSLARALYSSAPVLIIDDVFSALDAKTSKWIFDSCFRSTFLQDRTVILSTHNVKLCRDSVDYFLVVRNGTVQMLRPEQFSEKINLETVNAKSTSCDDDVKEPRQRAFHQGLPEEEKSLEIEVAEDVNSLKLILRYFSKFGSRSFIAFTVISVALSQLLNAAIQLWITMSTGSSENDDSTGKISADNFMLGYGILLLMLFGADLVQSLAFFFGGMNASQLLHKEMTKRVFHSHMYWFSQTPLGRIIQRFAKDIIAVDNLLWCSLEDTINCLMLIIVGLGSVSFVMPVFLFLALIVSVVAITIGHIYTKAQRHLTGLVAAKTSVVFNLMNETIEGLAVIRAFKKMEYFANMNILKLDNMIAVQYISIAINRWIAVRSDGISGIVGFLAGVIALMSKNISAEYVGFSLNGAVGFSTIILIFVRASNELLTLTNNYERVEEYTMLPMERPEKDELKASLELSMEKQWPPHGGIRLKNYSVKYSPNAKSDVLHGLNVTIQPGEKVAVVGRTGSGKSTFALSLLRFTVRTEGILTIDGADIEKMDLTRLRKGIALIPQDPVMMAGTIRSNLDPLNEFDDSDLFSALDASGASDILANDFQSPSEKKLRSSIMDMPVKQSGRNFSQGQRQILALARAIVRKPRIIILDECTASLDDNADLQLQKNLRTVFRSATVICIAHRISTILDYDKVLVLGEGRVLEYDSPHNLLSLKKGTFYELCLQSNVVSVKA